MAQKLNLVPSPMKYLYVYRNIAVPSNLVTVICCFQSEVILISWMKLITTLIFITYIHIFRPDIIFFFMNIGFGRMRFYSVMLIADALIFITAITLITLLS